MHYGVPVLDYAVLRIPDPIVEASPLRSSSHPLKHLPQQCYDFRLASSPFRESRNPEPPSWKFEWIQPNQGLPTMLSVAIFSRIASPSKTKVRASPLTTTKKNTQVKRQKYCISPRSMSHVQVSITGCVVFLYKKRARSFSAERRFDPASQNQNRCISAANCHAKTALSDFMPDARRVVDVSVLPLTRVCAHLHTRVADAVCAFYG